MQDCSWFLVRFLRRLLVDVRLRRVFTVYDVRQESVLRIGESLRTVGRRCRVTFLRQRATNTEDDRENQNVRHRREYHLTAEFGTFRILSIEYVSCSVARSSSVHFDVELIQKWLSNFSSFTYLYSGHAWDAVAYSPLRDER